ncbi:MAG: hypothetical protein ACOYI8_01120 [Christensenellales bacterium]
MRKNIGSQLPDAQSLLLNEPEMSEDLLVQARYHAAQAYFDAKEYETASELFAACGVYADAQERALDARYALGASLLEAGSYAPAERTFLALGGYRDSAQQAQNAHLLRRQNTKMVHISMGEQDRIACGRAHTVYLSQDGMVTAKGDNTYGQTDVSGLQNAVQADCGAYHSVVLLSNGTVTASGDNTYGQCDVSGYTDVIRVAATAYDTVVLFSDGTVSHTGWHEYPIMDEWNDVSYISAGSYGVVAVANGTVLATHPSMSIEGDEYTFAVCTTACAAALKADGSCAFSFDGAPQWQDIRSLFACETAIFGIDRNGRVLAHFFRASDAFPVETAEPVLAVAGSGTQYAFLMQSGKVVQKGAR